ncbi:hypothetical protein AD998_01980 [bacterium 336/3]|nr:hypothetical protein AD998_01980 [bacterium 336/3]
MQSMKRKRIAYCPDYAILFDSVEVAVFLSQFEYWTGKQKDIDGWIYKGQEEIYKETGLKETKQKVVRKLLKENNILFEKRKIVFEKRELRNLLHYKFDFEHLEHLLEHPENVKTRYENQISNTQKKNDTEKQTCNLHTSEEQPNTESFEIFWKIYDKNIGKSATQIQWDKMSEENQNKAITHAREFAKNTEKQFRPNPLKYLSEQKYLDEIIITNQKQRSALTTKQDEYTSSQFVGIKNVSPSN